MQVNDYLSHTNLAEVQEKGFSVYRYLTPKKLLMTVQEDYLYFLLEHHYFFMVMTILVGLFSYFFEYYFVFAYYIAAAYGLLFSLLFTRLLYRTYCFFIARNVIYTHQGIVFGKKVFNYSDEEQLVEKLDKYARMFKEYLSKNSTLDSTLSRKRLRLFSRLKEDAKQLGDASNWLDFLDRFVIAALALFFLHAGLLVVFYFVGLLFGYLFFGVYGALIWIYLQLHDSKALAIQREVEEIDEKLKELETTYCKMKAKMAEFTEGEISDISGIVGQQFESFYSKMGTIITKQRHLHKLIDSSRYRTLIDFSLFANYLRLAFNRPVHEILDLLNETQKSIDRQLTEIGRVYEGADQQHRGQLELKRIQLQMMIRQIRDNKARLNNSLL